MKKMQKGAAVMAFIQCDFRSEALGMATHFCAILPAEDGFSPAGAPVVWLLHGLTDDSTAWQRYTGLEWYARLKQAVVVMPEVQRSFYTDMASGPAYFTYVSEELPAFCRRMFGLSGAREQNFVMGNSMGGYGALKCALRRPQQYAGAAAFSAVMDANDFLHRRQASGGLHPGEAAAVFGPGEQVPAAEDLFALLGAADPAALPRLFVGCGTADRLWPMNQEMHRRLNRRGVAHEFCTCPGGHTWDVWGKLLQTALDRFLGPDKLSFG